MHHKAGSRRCWVDSGEAALQTETVHGYNVVSWEKDDFEFRAVSDLNLDELRDFARRIRP